MTPKNLIWLGLTFMALGVGITIGVMVWLTKLGLMREAAAAGIGAVMTTAGFDAALEGLKKRMRGDNE